MRQNIYVYTVEKARSILYGTFASRPARRVLNLDLAAGTHIYSYIYTL